MNKKLSISLIIATFLLGLAIVSPNSMAVSTVSVTKFYDEHIEPVMALEANFYDPMFKTSFNKSFRITFPELQHKSQTITPSAKVDYELDAATSDHFLSKPTELKRVRNWYDGAVTYEDVNPTILETSRETGYYFEGYYPSPNQVADFIAYANGWTLNYVASAERVYECGKTPINAIYEEEIPNMPVISTYESGELNIVQEGLALKAPQSEPPKNIPLQTFVFNITDLEPTKDFGLSWLIATLIIGLVAGFFTGWGVMTIFDPTPFSEDDRDNAHLLGYGQGVNETIAYYEQRLLELLANKDIDNTTYSVLTSSFSDAYPTVMSSYVNPYGDVGGAGGNSWFHTILTVIEQAIIWTIVIIVAVLAFWLVRKTGIFKRGKGESEGGSGGATYLIKASEARSSLKDAYRAGISTGAL